jgi:hypothetical protein
MLKRSIRSLKQKNKIITGFADLYSFPQPRDLHWCIRQSPVGCKTNVTTILRVANKEAFN